MVEVADVTPLVAEMARVQSDDEQRRQHAALAVVKALMTSGRKRLQTLFLREEKEQMKLVAEKLAAEAENAKSLPGSGVQAGDNEMVERSVQPVVQSGANWSTERVVAQLRGRIEMPGPVSIELGVRYDQVAVAVARTYR